MRTWRHGVLFLVLAVLASGLSAAERPPNVLLIMVDDLGWQDLACQGNRRLQTPHLDALAAQGVRFTDAYAAAPVCSPTRAAVLTGLAPARLRITNHIPDQPRFTPDNAVVASATTLDHLPAEYVTLPELLKPRGYAAGFFGKWHLAGARIPNKQGQGDLRFYPERQGFDINRGGCAVGGPFSFFDPYNLHNLPPRKQGEYLPDRLADELVQFVKTAGERPWLAFLWNYTVHWPMEAPQELVEKYRARDDLDGIDPRYAAMIEAMDASIGRLLAELDALRMRDNTLVIFTSDNGAFGGVADNRPLRAAKGFLYEGGIRVPLIIRWPGQVAAGRVCGEPVISMDFLPTVLEATGIAPPADQPADGVSLWPVLRPDTPDRSRSLQREAIYFHYPNYAFHRDNRLGSAVRAGRYKLIERFDDGSVELYDLHADIGERRDLAAQFPDVADRLRRQLTSWRQNTNAAIPPRLPAAPDR